MKKTALEDMLSALKDIQAELHGHLDKRAVRHLRDQVDCAIVELEAAIEHKDALTQSKLLALIAAVVEKIPIIAQAIEHLTKK